MNAEIKLCPKGTAPYSTDKRCGGIVMRQYRLQCNCGCCRVSVTYHEGQRAGKRAKAQAIAEWNVEVKNYACAELRKEAGNEQ